MSNNNNQSSRHVNVGRNHRDEVKREFIRGMEQAKAVHENSSTAFIEMIRDKLSDVDVDMEPLSTVQEMVDDVVALIDDYLINKVPAMEIVKRETDPQHMLEEFRRENRLNNGEDVISLMDLVEDDNK